MDQNGLGIPIAIVASAALIAGAIFFSGNSNDGSQVAQLPEAVEREVAPVSDSDHIRGNPNAPIVFIEYSDYDCAFCKQFHESMSRIIDEYGLSGQVAWVYRHYPIAQLHKNAPYIAEAAECVADSGGEEAFWTFSDLIFSERDIREPTNIERLEEFAEIAGADVAAFNTCLATDKFADEIQEAIVAAKKAGATGTPYTVLMVGNQQGVIDGAQSYIYLKQVVEGLLTQLQGGTILGQ